MRDHAYPVELKTNQNHLVTGWSSPNEEGDPLNLGHFTELAANVLMTLNEASASGAPMKTINHLLRDLSAISKEQIKMNMSARKDYKAYQETL